MAQNTYSIEQKSNYSHFEFHRFYSLLLYFLDWKYAWLTNSFNTKPLSKLICQETQIESEEIHYTLRMFSIIQSLKKNF